MPVTRVIAHPFTPMTFARAFAEPLVKLDSRFDLNGDFDGSDAKAKDIVEAIEENREVVLDLMRDRCKGYFTHCALFTSESLYYSPTVFLMIRAAKQSIMPVPITYCNTESNIDWEEESTEQEMQTVYDALYKCVGVQSRKEFNGLLGIYSDNILPSMHGVTEEQLKSWKL